MSITMPTPPTRTLRASVRDMAPADIDAVVALDAASTGRPEPDLFTTAIRRTAHPEDETQAGDTTVALVAEVSGEVLGFVVARLVPGPNPAEPTGLIRSIAVDRAWRGYRIGSLLMRAVRERLSCEAFAMEPGDLVWDGVDLSGFFHSTP